MKPEETRNLIENSDVFETTFTGSHTSTLGVEENVGIPDEYRTTHTLSVGATGVGKTQTIIHAILQDINKGQGLCFINPKGFAVNQIIAKMPEERYQDLIYINPSVSDDSGEDTVPPINVLEPYVSADAPESVKENQREIIVSDVMELFKRESKDWGDRFPRILEALLRACVTQNIENRAGYTLIDVYDALSDNQLLDELIEVTDDPVLLKQLTRIDEEYGVNERDAVLHRLENFISNKIIRGILSAKQVGIDFKEAVENQKIILIDVREGETSGKVARLVGSIILTKIWTAVQTRANQEPGNRDPFYLYVDELQRFASEGSALITMLAEAREYELGCWLATQYLSHLSKDMRKAVTTNCRSKLVFSPEGDDQSHLASLLRQVEKQHLQQLNEYRAMLQTPGDDRQRPNVVNTYPPWDAEWDEVSDVKEEQSVSVSLDDVVDVDSPGEVFEQVSDQTGSDPTAGKRRHDQLLAAAKLELQDRGFQVKSQRQRSGVEKPDGKVLLDGQQAYLEAESSSLSKPVKVLNNYRRATEDGVECIFVVEEGGEERLKRIVDDPVNREGDEFEDDEGNFSYYKGEDGEFTDIELLQEQGEYRVLSFCSDNLDQLMGGNEEDTECPLLDQHPREELETMCYKRDPDTGYCSALGQQCVLTETDD